MAVIEGREGCHGALLLRSYPNHNSTTEWGKDALGLGLERPALFIVAVVAVLKGCIHLRDIPHQ